MHRPRLHPRARQGRGLHDGAPAARRRRGSTATCCAAIESLARPADRAPLLPHLDREAVEDTLTKLARQGSLVRYPPLVEEEGVMVAQTEHSLYLGPDGVEILTA